MAWYGTTVDAVLEASVVGSFSRIGCRVRGAVGGWADADRRLDLTGRTVLVTGATSGIGLAVAQRAARLGATVRFVARDAERAAHAQALIRRSGGDAADVAYEIGDLSDLASLRALATRLEATLPRLDVLVHNAGALHRTFARSPEGYEITVASHVYGPFLLTGLLLPLLRAAAPGRVITVSSGGMYTQRFELDTLEAGPADYDGAVAYARAKRAQVVLGHEWARRVPSTDVVFHTMHPGWVDTPGVAIGLPAFHRVMGPLLRDPAEGADTIVWLAASDEGARGSGAFWLDRRRRTEHRLPWTRHGDDSRALWERCEARTGWVGP